MYSSQCTTFCTKFIAVHCIQAGLLLRLGAPASSLAGSYPQVVSLADTAAVLDGLMVTQAPHDSGSQGGRPAYECMSRAVTTWLYTHFSCSTGEGHGISCQACMVCLSVVSTASLSPGYGLTCRVLASLLVTAVHLVTCFSLCLLRAKPAPTGPYNLAALTLCGLRSS